MSNSLTINTPNIVQQNTPLRNVPSGSTAEQDYNVKYVPQSLTDAQKAQARQNIGAAAEGQGGGGNAADLDTYWIVYPEGDTTISLHAGTINKLWMDGFERSATEGVYTVYKGSTVRIDASANASFIFGNTTDPIWLWSPAGINVNEPVYGTMQNVNLVNRNGGGSNLNFGGRMWLMNNKFSASMYTMTDVAVEKSPRIYLSDTPIDVNIESQDTPDLDYCPVIFYVPASRYDELKEKLSTKYGDSWFRRFAYNIVQVQSITQCDNTLDVVYCDVEDAYATITIYNNSNNTYTSSNDVWQNFVNGVLVGNEVDGKFNDLAITCGTGWGGCGGERITPQHIEDRFTVYPGKNVFVMNFSKDQTNHNKMFPGLIYSGISEPLWIYAKNMYSNPLMSGIQNPDDVNIVYINYKNDSFGIGNGGTSFIYNKNNQMMDTRFYLVYNNKVVLTDDSMSGVHRGGEITQASDVKATVYCPRSRYAELVAKYEELYASEIAGGTFDITWITDHIVKYDYIEDVDYRKNIVIMEQAQSDWNQTDTTAPDYIKNKPTIDTKYFGDLMDMYNTINIFTTHNGKTVWPNNGNELGNVKDIIIGVQSLNGLTMFDSPHNESGTWHGRTTLILDPTKMQYNGYWRFYPDSELDDLWFYPGLNDTSQKGRIDTPIQEIWCKDLNIVLRGTTGAYNNYKRINRIKQNLQLVTKFTVWNTTNTGWQGLWDGTGDVVLFDIEMEKFVEAVNAPSSLIGFKIYMPKSRYTEFVTAMETAWGQSAVENYILPKVEQYDFIYSEGFKYKMFTFPTA